MAWPVCINAHFGYFFFIIGSFEEQQSKGTPQTGQELPHKSFGLVRFPPQQPLRVVARRLDHELDLFCSRPVPEEVVGREDFALGLQVHEGEQQQDHRKNKIQEEEQEHNLTCILPAQRKVKREDSEPS